MGARNKSTGRAKLLLRTSVDFYLFDSGFFVLVCFCTHIDLTSCFTTPPLLLFPTLCLLSFTLLHQLQDFDFHSRPASSRIVHGRRIVQHPSIYFRCKIAVSPWLWIGSFPRASARLHLFVVAPAKSFLYSYAPVSLALARGGSRGGLFSMDSRAGPSDSPYFILRGKVRA